VLASGGGPPSGMVRRGSVALSVAKHLNAQNILDILDNYTVIEAAKRDSSGSAGEHWLSGLEFETVPADVGRVDASCQDFVLSIRDRQGGRGVKGRVGKHETFEQGRGLLCDVWRSELHGLCLHYKPHSRSWRSIDASFGQPLCVERKHGAERKPCVSATRTPAPAFRCVSIGRDSVPAAATVAQVPQVMSIVQVLC